MTYISLYRKWRPQSFAELVGQDHIATTLANSIESDRVGHAYLFAGPRGTGKTSTAKILAKSINCERGPSAKPCQKCDSCVSITRGVSLDVLEMDAASNRGIDEIRELRDKIAFSATSGRFKIYIIDEVHMLTEPAFNALLKTIEEPPAHVIFALATTDPNKVPDTITSRCQSFEFRRIPRPALVEHLGKIAKAEKIKINEGARAVIAAQAEGSLRDAIGMLDQLSTYSQKEITELEVNNIFALTDAGLVESAVDLIISKDMEQAFEFVADLSENGRDMRQFTGALIAHLRNLYVLAYVSGEERRRQLVPVGDEAIARYTDQVRDLGVEKIRSLLDQFSRLFETLRSAAEPRLALELTFVNLLRGDELTLEALALRIDRLEAGGVSKQPPPSRYEQKTAEVKAEVKVEKKETVEKSPVVQQVKHEETQTSQPKTVKKKKVKAGVAVDVEQVRTTWPEVLQGAKERKLSLSAFLFEATPLKLEKGCLTVSFPPKAAFAQNAMEKKQNVDLVKEVLAEVLGTNLNFATVLSAEAAEEPVAPIKPEVPEVGDIAQTAVHESPDVQDGPEDVLDLMKKSFGAEIVDEKA